jgi:hypothetical protein
VQVFPSLKHASDARHFKSLGAISKAIKNKSQSSGHYWMRYKDCKEELKLEYEKNNALPNKPSKKNSIKVQQFTTGKGSKFVKEYSCISDVTTMFQMSRQKLKDVSTNQLPFNGYIWKIVKTSGKPVM